MRVHLCVYHISPGPFLWLAKLSLTLTYFTIEVATNSVLCKLWLYCVQLVVSWLISTYCVVHQQTKKQNFIIVNIGWHNVS